jgi:hypothetical protein
VTSNDETLLVKTDVEKVVWDHIIDWRLENLYGPVYPEWYNENQNKDR